MSEFNQVDLQIGTEEQFETKKANLSEGVIVGLTDPIHENELDSALQTKLDGIKKVYQHRITISENNTSRLEIVILINTDITPFTFNTFRSLLSSATSLTNPFNGLSIVETRKFFNAPPSYFDIYDMTQTTNSNTSDPSITVYWKPTYDTDVTNISSQELFESDGFVDTVIEL